MSETLILVDKNDQPIGTQEKLAAHLIPQRHRAFSVFIFNDKGETLIQRRALGKYHSPGLWANSCCGHPRPGEDIEQAARRRLNEEIGFCCPLTPITKVCYTLKLEKDLWELEYTHVFKGEYEGKMDLNPEEVCEIQWIDPEALRQDVIAHPQNYARWFRLYILKHFVEIFSGLSLSPSSFPRRRGPIAM
jgi:isopentenyl-diphosphate delta-isomerase